MNPMFLIGAAFILIAVYAFGVAAGLRQARLKFERLISLCSRDTQRDLLETLRWLQ